MAITGGNIGFTGYQQPDYSGVVQAAGLPMQAIAQGIDQAQDYFKQQGEKKKLIKKSDIQIDAALKLFPDLAPTLQGVRDQIRDENVPLNERAGIAESVAGLINMGTNQMQAMAELGLKKRQLDIQEGQGIQSALMRQAEMQAKANEPTKLKPKKTIVGDLEVPMLMDDYGNYYDPQSKLRIIDLPGYAQGLPAENVLEQTDTFDFSQPSGSGAVGPIEMGNVLPELTEGVPVLPKDAQAAADIAGAGLIDGLPTVGLPIEQDQSQVVQAGLDAIPASQVQAGQVPAPTLTPRGITIGKEAKGEVVTAEEAQKRVASGLSVTSTPIGGGMVRITSQTGSPKPSPVIESPESKVQSQRLLKLDESLSALRDAGTTASLDVEPLNEITKLLDSGVKTGFGRESLMLAKKITGQDVSNEEQFQARVGAEAMKNIALTKGAISDREMDYFKTVLSPNMGKTTEGNKKIIDFRIKYAKRANKISETISNLQEQGKSPFEIKKEVDKIISSESLVAGNAFEKPKVDQAAEDAEFLKGF